MRRLEFAREQLAQGRSLVDVAIKAGFVDQAHFSRMFKATFGITPALYRSLRVPEGSRKGDGLPIYRRLVSEERGRSSQPQGGNEDGKLPELAAHAGL